MKKIIINPNGIEEIELTAQEIEQAEENDLITQESLNGCLSSCSFLHATNLEIYNQLIKIETID